MLNESAKAKLIAAVQPLYTDSDFSNVVGNFILTVETSPEVVVTPPNDSEIIDVVKA